jgi:hypothetical protein
MIVIGDSWVSTVAEQTVERRQVLLKNDAKTCLPTDCQNTVFGPTDTLRRQLQKAAGHQNN